MSHSDEYWMRYALQLAHQAAQAFEVPVGAVVVHDGQIIGQGYNQSICQHDPTAHAEVVALRQAAMKLANYRLPDTTLYVTLEPCAMCAAALVHARVKRLVFGAYDAQTGAAGSILTLVDHPALNHQLLFRGGVLAREATELLQDFFRQRR
jgi:tRNA(adenine34) deaminase